MPQLEVFLFGDQFLIIFLIYIIFYFSLLMVELFLIGKVFSFNVFFDNLSKEYMFMLKI